MTPTESSSINKRFLWTLRIEKIAEFASIIRYSHLFPIEHIEALVHGIFEAIDVSSRV
jgi:hypothetical protein